MSKERLTKITISLLLLFSIVVGISFAFLLSSLEGEETVDISVRAKTIDVLTFNVADDFKIDVTPETFTENGDNITQTFTATASLIANNSTNKANYNYYVYLLIHDNTLEYTQSPDVPELLLNVTGPNDPEITIANLDKKSVKGLNGFDITKANGLYLINSSDMEITSNSSILATDKTWTFSITLVNLDNNQLANVGNNFKASIIMRSEPIDEVNIASVCKGDELANCIVDNYKLDSSIIYHDGKQDNPEEENYTLEAGDLSYRYHGANPNNYVCLGYECSDNPDEPGYKNLYRIIGLFKNEDNGQYETKIIKADAATKEDLGNTVDPEGSAYYGNYDISRDNYKGKLTTFASYYWNSTDGTSSSNDNVNMWGESNLNTENLNKKYYNAIEEPYKAMVVEHKWQVGGTVNKGSAKSMYDSELGSGRLTNSSNFCYTQGNKIDQRKCSELNDLTYNAYVGLMYLSDYMYGTLPKYWTTTTDNYNQEEVKSNNWLYLGISEWTISRRATDGINVRRVLDPGNVDGSNAIYSYRSVRPVVYLSSSVKISGGSGTETDPFMLEI